MLYHNDTIIKTDAGRLLYKYIPLTLFVRVRKGLLKVCVCEGVGDQTETSIFSPLNLWPSTLCLSCSLMLNRGPWGPGFLYCILSATSLVPKLHRGSQGPLRPGVAFLTTSRLSPSPTLLELQLS